MSLIELSTSIAALPERCFDLSLDVGVHIASGGRERVVSGVNCGIMGLGDQVTWQAWHFGIPWRMTSMIVELHRPSYFADEMKSGPFGRWCHEHYFSIQDGRTIMVDRVDYDVPFGLLGRLADGLLLKGHMEQLLLRRNSFIRVQAERTGDA